MPDHDTTAAADELSPNELNVLYGNLPTRKTMCASWCGNTGRSQYNRASMLVWSPLLWVILGVVFFLLGWAYFIGAMWSPTACGGHVVKLHPCPDDQAFPDHTVVGGIVETVLCGEPCGEFLCDTPVPGSAWPAARPAGIPEAYFVQLMLRTPRGRASECDPDASAEWACVELCRAVHYAPPADQLDDYVEAPCRGCEGEGLWVSTLPDDCVVLGGKTGYEDSCLGSTEGAIDYECARGSVGVPFGDSVSDWLRWDDGLGYTWGLYEEGCIAYDDDDCGCSGKRRRRRRGGSGCSCAGDDDPDPVPDPEPDPSPSPQPDPEPEPEPEPELVIPASWNHDDMFDERDDMVPRGVDRDDVNWRALPVGNYEFLRTGNTMALVVTRTDGSRLIEPGVDAHSQRFVAHDV